MQRSDYEYSKRRVKIKYYLYIILGRQSILFSKLKRKFSRSLPLVHKINIQINDIKRNVIQLQGCALLIMGAQKRRLRRNSDSLGVFPEGASIPELNIRTSDKHFMLYEDAKSHIVRMKVCRIQNKVYLHLMRKS